VGGWRGPGWRVFQAEPRNCKGTRDWLTGVMDVHDCPVDRDEVALAVAELFNNAVVHGPPGGRVLVGYCLWRRGARIVVCDGGGAGVPRLRESNGLAEGGWDLHVVESLAVQWGTFRLERAQAVWCDFAEPLRAPAADTWAWLRAILPGLSLDPAGEQGARAEGTAPLRCYASQATR
jgi:anti-sigma regulatory factor (Ser/Thr protein kinase)